MFPFQARSMDCVFDYFAVYIDKTHKERQKQANLYLSILHERKVTTTFICLEAIQGLSGAANDTHKRVKDVCSYNRKFMFKSFFIAGY